jgi:hypothetical protein
MFNVFGAYGPYYFSNNIYIIVSPYIGTSRTSTKTKRDSRVILGILILIIFIFMSMVAIFSSYGLGVAYSCPAEEQEERRRGTLFINISCIWSSIGVGV